MYPMAPKRGHDNLQKLIERTAIALALLIALGFSLLIADPEGAVSTWLIDQLRGDPPYHFAEDPGEGYRAVYPFYDAAGAVQFASALTQVPVAQRDRVGRLVLPVERPLSDFLEGPKVVVYAASWCPYCKDLIHALDRRGILFETKDVERSGAIERELLEISGSTAIPFAIVNGQSFTGYDPERLDELLRSPLPPLAHLTATMGVHR